MAKDVLAKKSDFLREKSKPLEIDFGDGLVPRLVFDATLPPSSGVVDNDAATDDDDDAMADDDDDAVADDDDDAVADDDDNAMADDDDDAMADDDDDAMADDDDDAVAYDDEDAVADDGDAAIDIDLNHGYAGSHMDHLSKEENAIFPYTIRYVDLTVLNLKNNLRAPLLMLFRNEWGTMIDIFNERKHLTGIRGSAVFTGQPGIGKRYYCHLTVTSNQRTRKNMPVVFHPHPLHDSRPGIRVSGHARQGLYH